MQLVIFVEQVIVKKGKGVLFETIQKYKSIKEEQGCLLIKRSHTKKLETTSLNYL